MSFLEMVEKIGITFPGRTCDGSKMSSRYLKLYKWVYTWHNNGHNAVYVYISKILNFETTEVQHKDVTKQKFWNKFKVLLLLYKTKYYTFYLVFSKCALSAFCVFDATYIFMSQSDSTLLSQRLGFTLPEVLCFLRAQRQQHPIRYVLLLARWG